MKYQVKFIATTTQIHTGNCYLIAMFAENSKTVMAYDIGGGGTGGATNTVGYIHEDGVNFFRVDKPGVPCGNGLNVAVDSGNVLVVWSI